jgi:excinuclease ABC subunit C
MAISPSLHTKIKGLAEEPGVYLMKDESGGILYIGKAKNLKSRVSSYFQETKDRPPRTELLVRKIFDLEVVLTDNEVEALILECNLIKKYRPRFNVRLKDDKGYPYVRLNLNHPYPRLEYVHHAKKDGAKYFGPYVSAYQIKDVLQWAQKAFRLRDCSDNEFRNRSRPCILYQMGQCSGPCVGLIKEEEYAQNIQSVLKLLDGKSSEVLREMKKRMAQAAESEEFELAAMLRDRIQHIEQVSEEQKITNLDHDHARDVVQFSRASSGKAVAVVLSIRDGRTVGVFQFPFDEVDPAMPDDEFLFGFLAQYYLKLHQETPQLLPIEVLIPDVVPREASVEGVQEGGLREQAALLSRALGRRVDFRVPKRGEAADLVAMVKKTSEHHLTDLVSRAANTVDDLMDAQKKLDLKRFPHRIECYDISHFQGEGTVASRVVFVDGKPEKALYRHYHVRELSSGKGAHGGDRGIDDFKSMREILERRFTNDHALPDLVIVDGGKGQLAQAEAIFNELGVVGVELVSIAKARTERDFQGSEVEASMERIFKPNQKNPIMLKPGTGAFRVMTQARDESHRFAITFHRKIRDKRVLGKKKGAKK